MTSTLLHQFAAEGRLNLSDRISAIMPEFPLPRGNTITVQHMLDHTAGLPGNSPLFSDGGLWTAYAPGAHWHYSNTAYEMLGKLAEHIGGKPLEPPARRTHLRSVGHAPQSWRNHRRRPHAVCAGL